MTAPILLIAFFLSGEAAPPAKLTLDLDGQGGSETATAVARGGKVLLEIRDERGKLLAESAVAAPKGSVPRVTVTAGSLGSAGAVLEVAATAGQTECRTLWRYRDRRLFLTPVSTSAGQVPDCGPPDWSYRWNRPSEDAPALYTRERSREKPDGVFRQVEAFRYTGFRLEPDPGHSSASLNGVEIPAWRDVVLYRRAAVDQLSARFDLSSFQSQPRLRVLADRAQGVFEVRSEDGPAQTAFPVTAATAGETKWEVVLTAGAQGIHVKVFLAGDGTAPREAVVQGLGERLDYGYFAVARGRGPGVYDSAEQELAEKFFPGTWEDGKDPVAVKLVSSSPAILRYGKADIFPSVTRAPRGADVLLLPKDGSPPAFAIRLRGPDSFTELPVRCEVGQQRCETLAAGRALRRMGARLNVQ